MIINLQQKIKNKSKIENNFNTKMKSRDLDVLKQDSKSNNKPIKQNHKRVKTTFITSQ